MANKLKIVTFNIRCVYNAPVDGINSFIHRAGMIRDKIANEKPDVVAFQEVTPEILSLLKIVMPEYSFHGHGRLRDLSGEGLYTAVRKDTASVIGMESFWISPEPNVPESRFAEAGQSECPRICVTTTVKHEKSGKLLRVYNVHLDHVAARVEGAKCVLSAIKADRKKADLSVVLLGDFNDYPESRPIRLCEKELTDITKEFSLTWHDFGRRKGECKIDYIFLSEDLVSSVNRVSLWKDHANGIWLSDHYPICATFNV